MNDITNTSRDERMPWALFGGAPGAIEAQEARGQAELLKSEMLPVKTQTDDDKFIELGFQFDEPVNSDDLFRGARLPDGWKREGSDHAMWSYIVDDRGIRRVSIFYKAAFYDRDAFMGLINVGANFVTEFVYAYPEDRASRPEWSPVYTEAELQAAIDTCTRNLEDEYASADSRAKYKECLEYLEQQR